MKFNLHIKINDLTKVFLRLAIGVLEEADANHLSPGVKAVLSGLAAGTVRNLGDALKTADIRASDRAVIHAALRILHGHIPAKDYELLRQIAEDPAKTPAAPTP